MTQSPAVVRPAPMEGRGFYNRSSREQAAGLSPAASLFELAARTAVLPQAPQPIVMADYGSSEGHNSLGPLAVAISALQEWGDPERAISVNHIPTMTGGVGHDQLKRFYKYHFIGGNPPDFRLTAVSRTVAPIMLSLMNSLCTSLTPRG